MLPLYEGKMTQMSNHRADEAACGRYRTRELVLGNMNALAVGDTMIALPI